MEAEFWEKHVAVLQPEPPSLGAGQEIIEDNAIHGSYKVHLANLDLVRVPSRGGYEITPLGRLLLRTLGLPTDLPY
jgi:hypothetical protein